jgi:hypothetical protein
MSKTYHVNFADRMGAALFIALLRAGIKIGTILSDHDRKLLTFE